MRVRTPRQPRREGHGGQHEAQYDKGHSVGRARSRHAQRIHRRAWREDERDQRQRVRQQLERQLLQELAHLKVRPDDLVLLQPAQQLRVLAAVRGSSLAAARGSSLNDVASQWLHFAAREWRSTSRTTRRWVAVSRAPGRAAGAPARRGGVLRRQPPRRGVARA